MTCNQSITKPDCRNRENSQSGTCRYFYYQGRAYSSELALYRHERVTAAAAEIFELPSRPRGRTLARVAGRGLFADLMAAFAVFMETENGHLHSVPIVE